MYVYMYVRIYECVYVCMYVRMHECMCVRTSRRQHEMNSERQRWNTCGTTNVYRMLVGRLEGYSVQQKPTTAAYN
jgi:hypothetical protein